MTDDRPLFGIATALTEKTLAPDILATWLEANGFESLWFGEHSHIPVDLKSERQTTKRSPKPSRNCTTPCLRS
jgi:alkanesulfonate monooxygenase SsuD/methylene tetrahydromethanopterin reductase-like flavin-dependent oxidoreductase (luciferase family)